MSMLVHCPVFDLFWAIIWWVCSVTRHWYTVDVFVYLLPSYCRGGVFHFLNFLLFRHFFSNSRKWENSKLLLYILNTICLPRPFLTFLHLHPQLPGGAVICPLRGGESVTCHVAPSSYDTRRHSTAVRASTELGSGDQIITLPGSISHIAPCYPEKRSHAICIESARRPVALVLAISTTRVQETLRSEVADSKVSV